MPLRPDEIAEVKAMIQKSLPGTVQTKTAKTLEVSDIINHIDFIGKVKEIVQKIIDEQKEDEKKSSKKVKGT
jgi:hypothetical protein